MDRTFRYDFSATEAAANARVLRRELYGASRWVYALVEMLPLALFATAVAGAYLGWWGDHYFTAVIVAAAIVLFWTRFVSPRLRRHVLKPAGGLLEGRAVEYEFGEDGYRIRTETFEGFQKWAGVDRIIDAKGSILLVLGLHAHFLPDRLFASAEARREFLLWVIGKISPEARARSRIAGA